MKCDQSGISAMVSKHISLNEQLLPHAVLMGSECMNETNRLTNTWDKV